ncbi:MAG: hypothetical protein WD078_05700 [Woeseia sp.]
MAILLCCPAVAAGEQFAPQPLFASHDTLAVRITAPLAAIQRERDSGDYHDGTFEFQDVSGTPHILDLKLRARGNYRRRADTCRFPPIRLNFRKSQVDGGLFDGQDKLKLVTHCHLQNTRYEQFILKEYLAYRILNELTDKSFSVRLLRIQWVDTDSPQDSVERYGFLIEDDDRLADRLGYDAVDSPGISPTELDPDHAASVAAFQYLIGNTDYSLIRGTAEDGCCHNAVLLGKGDQRYLSVPYDFDFAGLVNAPYAEPNPSLRIRSVRTRLYRGYCDVNDALEPALQTLRGKRTDILALIRQQEGLDDRSRDQSLRYVEDFYKAIDKPATIKRRMLSRCI